MPVYANNIGFTKHTLVMTQSGYKYIVDMNNTIDTIWNGTNWMRVKIYKSGTTNTIYSITLSNGEKIYCSKDHEIITRINGSVPKYETANNLQEGYNCILTNRNPSIRSNFYTLFDMENEDPPINANICLQLCWLAKHLDKIAGCMQITHNDESWLKKIQLMAHCLGTMPFITNSPRGYHLRFCTKDATMLLEEMSMPFPKKISEFCFVDNPIVSISSIKKYTECSDVYSLERI